MTARSGLEPRTTTLVSPEAMRRLADWVPIEVRREAWFTAYDVYVRRAPTSDGSEVHYAAERANRFWPNYAGPPRHIAVASKP